MGGEQAGAAHLLRSFGGANRPVFTRGQGVELELSTGHVVLDAACGVGVTCLGYSAEPVVRRMTEQAGTLPYAHAMRFETPVMSELAGKVAAKAPGDLNHCFFVSGGSEAVESALKLARQYWIERGQPGKGLVIGRRPSFHGSTLATLSVGWYAARRETFAPLLLPTLHVPSPNRYRGCTFCGGVETGCTAACANALEKLILEQGPENVAAFIAEPIVGAAGGALVPPAGYFQRVKEICQTHDVLFIADEVITGFGRTGRWFGVEHEDVVPDILVFAKGIGAGYAPLGGIVVRDRVAEAIHGGSGAFQHNFTLASHAVSCAVGCAVIDEFERQDLIAKVAERADLLRSAFDGLAESGIVGDIRGRGYLLGIELVADRLTKQPFPRSAQVAARIAVKALEEGVLIYPCGGADGDSDYLLVMPAFVMEECQFAQVADRVNRAIHAVEAELRS
jgi:adenosylmethionine-8-amino-7-oxononanoate aminotransferase